MRYSNHSSSNNPSLHQQMDASQDHAIHEQTHPFLPQGTEE